MHSGMGRHPALAGELAEWWEDLCQRGIGSRVVLVAVPSRWGRTTVLDSFAADIAGPGDGPVTLTARINGKLMPDEIGLQAAVLRECLASIGVRHRSAELLGLDRLGGTAQLGLGVGGLFVSGMAAGVSFLLAGFAIGAAGKAWDDSPAGQDGAVARAARSVAAVSASVPVVVIVDDADHLDQDLAITMIENLTARRGSQVLVVVAADPGGVLAMELRSRAWTARSERPVQTAEADPDMSFWSRLELTRDLCPQLPDAAIHRIATRTMTFADVFAIALAPRLRELGPGADNATVLTAVEAVIDARLRLDPPSLAAVVVAWAGGLLHSWQASRALEVLNADLRGAHGDVMRWGSLIRLSGPASPRLAEQVAVLSARDRQAMAAAVLEEAVRIVLDSRAGLVDRVVAAQAAHRIRADLPDRVQLRRVQCELVAGLEALGDTAAALDIAQQALAEWPRADRYQDGRDELAALAFRLSRAAADPRQEPLAAELIATATTNGAAVGLEARIWAAVDLLERSGGREMALQLINQVIAELDNRTGLGEAGYRWRLLLAFHAGRNGYQAMAGHLLAPLLGSGDERRRDIARSVLYAVDEPGADLRLQSVLLEAELAALPRSSDDDRLRVHRALAENYENLGDYRRALTHRQHELNLRKALYSPDHPDTLQTWASIADLTGLAGDAVEALRLHQLLLPEIERVLGAEDHRTLAARARVASWTGECGDTAGALDLLWNLHPDMERILGRSSYDTLFVRSKIAGLTSNCGDSLSALRMFQDLLHDMEWALGRGHHETLEIRRSIAITTSLRGDYAGALRVLQDLQPDWERGNGAEHPSTLVLRNDIADLIGMTGDTAEALRLNQNLLPDQERILGPRHPATLKTRLNIADMTGRNGDAAGALRQYRSLLPLVNEAHGPDHPSALALRHNIAGWTGYSGDAAGALQLYSELLPDMERARGAEHPYTLSVYNNIAGWTAQLGDAAGARQMYRELLPMMDRVLGPNHPDTQDVRAGCTER